MKISNSVVLLMMLQICQDSFSLGLEIVSFLFFWVVVTASTSIFQLDGALRSTLRIVMNAGKRGDWKGWLKTEKIGASRI